MTRELGREIRPIVQAARLHVQRHHTEDSIVQASRLHYVGNQTAAIGRNNVMGMQQTVIFEGPVPAWTGVRDDLAGRGYRFEVRMIDGELTFPGEEPAAEWRELRLSTPEGMITLRREEKRLHFITWANAPAGLEAQRHALASAFASAGGGRVEPGEGT